MDKFTRNLLTEWRKLNLPFARTRAIAAVSGGADSICLLASLNRLVDIGKLKLEIVVAHLNHGLRGDESNSDEKLVGDFASQSNIPFESEIAKLPKNGNLEENARIARYDFLERIAKKYNSPFILTAHTRNDQAETLLMNLIRGSGLDGLAAMKRIRPISKNSEIQIVRPLLNWANREDTEDFCLTNAIRYVQDSMNFDPKFARVRIRREIIPLLKELNPRIIETLTKTSEMLLADSEELGTISETHVANFDQNSFRLLSKSLRFRVLRLWLEREVGDLRGITTKHLEAIEKLILSSKSGRISELPKGGRIIKKDGEIHFEKTGVEKSSPDN